MSAAGMRVASFGCDGGVHGMEVVRSLHSTEGKKLSIVDSRVALNHAGINGRFGIQIIMCKTTKGNVIAGILDPSHILKRQQEASASGIYLQQMGPRDYCSHGFWHMCGVPLDRIIKPDAMSDALTQAAYSSDTISKLFDAPQGINPTGTIVMLFVVGEVFDATQADAMLDVERVARLSFGATFLTILREFVRQDASATLGVNGMHPTPYANFQSMCNGFLSLLLGWLTTLPNEPQNPKAHGSLRLEARIGIRRGQNGNLDEFTVLDLMNNVLRDLVGSTLVASGRFKRRTNNKGYVASEERPMAEEQYTSTPQSILESVMYDAVLHAGRALCPASSHTLFPFTRCARVQVLCR